MRCEEIPPSGLGGDLFEENVDRHRTKGEGTRHPMITKAQIDSKILKTMKAKYNKTIKNGDGFIALHVYRMNYRSILDK